MVVALCATSCTPNTASESATPGPAAPEIANEIKDDPSPSSATQITTSTTTPSPIPGSSGADVSFDLDAIALEITDRLRIGYGAVAGVWTGFEPLAHPAVVVVRDGTRLAGLVAINHQDPRGLGEARVISDDSVLGTAHVVSDPVDRDLLARVDVPGRGAPFLFDAMVGGHSSLLIVASAEAPPLDPSSPDFAAVFLHELFHRHQRIAFTATTAVQDIDGYAFDPPNLRALVLEDLALRAALGAADETALRQHASIFAQLRSARLERDPRVVLDGAQERLEGTARHLEHLVGDALADARRTSGNHAEGLLVGFAPPDGAGITTRQLIGERWYASGAALMELLARLEVHDAQERVTGGATPAGLLIDVLSVAPRPFDDVVGQASDRYDPSRELVEASAAASELAATDPPVFSGLTREQVACFVENGVDLDSSEPPPDVIIERCR